MHNLVSTSVRNLLHETGVSVLENEPMSRHTTFRIGGPADYLCVAKEAEHLLTIVRCCREREIPFFILGGGSNILVADRGIRGVVIKNQTSHIEWSFHGPVIDSGIYLPKLALALARKGLSGCEYLQTVPGTVGGGVIQNARFRNPNDFSAYDGLTETRNSDIDMASILDTIWILDANNNVLEHARHRGGFDYEGFKHSDSQGQPDEVVLRVQLRTLEERPQEEIRATMKIFAHWRNQRIAILNDQAYEQPPDSFTGCKAGQPRGPSAGCVFYNVINEHNHPTGRLIDLCGLKGVQIGGAQIAPEHANYIINRGNARAEDVRALMEICKEHVRQRFGVELREEIRFVGDW